jgi:hypothetical protein
LLLDEVHPGMKKSNRETYSLDEWKSIFDSVQGGQVDGKGQNGTTTGVINFEPYTSRIICYNANNPHQWMASIPEDVLADDAVRVRAALDVHTLAILKRVAFLHIPSKLISASAAQEHVAIQAESVRSEFARLYGGANAIP